MELGNVRGSIPIHGLLGAGITNAMNAAHKGLYKELQTIPAGGTWEESFWVRPSGF